MQEKEDAFLNRTILLQFLEKKFKEEGFTEEEASLYVTEFEKKYEQMTDEELETDILRQGGPSKVAAALIQKRNQAVEEDEEYRSFVEQTMMGQTKADDEQGQSESSEKVSDEDEEQEEQITDENEEVNFEWEDNTPTQTLDSSEITVRQAKLRDTSSAEEEKDTERLDSEKSAETRLAQMTYRGPASEEGFKKFWTLFAITSPLTLILLLIAGVIAAAGVGASILLTVGSFALLIVWVAAGSALSLIGIIYGVSQLFITQPVGLFELGLGIVLAGITMLFGILIYNFASRVMPFVTKKAMLGVRMGVRYLRDLFFYVRGEYYKK